jgi:hypothetical protein
MHEKLQIQKKKKSESKQAQIELDYSYNLFCVDKTAEQILECMKSFEQINQTNEQSELGISKSHEKNDTFILRLFLNQEQFLNLKNYHNDDNLDTFLNFSVEYVLVALTVQELQKLVQAKKNAKTKSLYEHAKSGFIPSDNVQLRIALEQKLTHFILGLDEYLKPDDLHKIQTITQVEAKLIRENSAKIVLDLDFLIDDKLSKEDSLTVITAEYEKTRTSRLRRIFLIHTLAKKYNLSFILASRKKRNSTALIELFKKITE